MIGWPKPRQAVPSGDLPAAALTGRLQSLDFLRGVAILMVVAYHFFGYVYQQDIMPWRGHWPDWSTSKRPSFKYLYWMVLGRDGVSLFFVLSGFCIHYATLRLQARGASFHTLQFYWRRFFRIVPTYWLAVLVALFVFDWGSWLNIATHVTLTHTLVAGRAVCFGLNPNFWTLAVEWHLYLIYPILVLLLRRFPAIAILALTFVITMVFQRYLHHTAPLDIRRLPFAFWFQWTIGAYIADAWFRRGRSAFRWLGLLLPLCTVLWVLTIYYRPMGPQAWWIRAMWSAAFLDAVLTLGQRPGPLYAWVCKIGIVSYSMYLFHLPFLLKVIPWLFQSLPQPISPAVACSVVLPVYLALMYAISWLSFRYVEMPSIALGQRTWLWTCAWVSSLKRGSRCA